MIDIKQIFQIAIERQASDIHIIAGYYPSLRINGILFYLQSFPVITKKDSEEMILSLLTEQQKELFTTDKEIDFGYEYQDNRLRVNGYYARNAVNLSFRLISRQIKSPTELGLPESLNKIINIASGLVLVTGPTGQGKSTTIASLVNEINLKQSKHILTVEDPVEYIFGPGRSIISQREIGQDTLSWTKALRASLREDPDIVFVGEMRDFESIAHVLTIAETGHLVFSTLHTISAAEAINRIIDVFPSHQQNQVKAQLSTVLRTVVSQRLLPRADNKGRVAALEILHNNPAVSNIIREGKFHLLENIIQTSEEQGFLYFEKHLKKLLDEGKITRETALSFAIRPKEVNKFF